MHNQNHRFVDAGSGLHVRADDVVAVSVESGFGTGHHHRVNVSLGAAGNGYVHNGDRLLSSAEALAAAHALCHKLTGVTGVEFVEVGDTSQFVRTDRVVSVQTTQDHKDRKCSWVTTVFLDAAGNGKAYRSRRTPDSDATSDFEWAFAAANADRDRLLGALI